MKNCEYITKVNQPCTHTKNKSPLQECPASCVLVRFRFQSSCQSKLIITSGMTKKGPLLISANRILHPFTQNLEAGKWELVAGNKCLELKQFLSLGEQLQEGTEFCWFTAVYSDSRTINGKCFFSRWIKNSGNVSEVRSLKSLVTVSVKLIK